MDYLNFTSQNIGWFNQRNSDESLDLRPKYQRNIVWNNKQRTYLIDSILHGFPIPELYIQEKVTSDGNTKYSVVDGQQRLTTVLMFIDNSFNLDPSETTEDWANLYFDDLTTSMKETFFRYKFVVRMLPNIPDSEVKDIFKRINKNNVALNNQELRQATYSGDFINVVNEISNKSYWQTLGIFSPAKIRRMLDVEYISEIAIALLNGHQNKKDKLDNYYKIYETSDLFSPTDLENTFDYVGKEITNILSEVEIKRSRWKTLTDFYTLFLVLAKYEDKFPLNREQRDTVNKLLMDFTSGISRILKLEELGEDDIIINRDTDRLLRKFAAGTRASTDLNSRKNRFDALNEYLITNASFLINE